MEAKFRFYATLNDFLSLERRQILFSYSFKGNPAIKDTIEAIGVPHTAIDVILANLRMSGMITADSRGRYSVKNTLKGYYKKNLKGKIKGIRELSKEFKKKLDEASAWRK